MSFRSGQWGECKEAHGTFFRLEQGRESGSGGGTVGRGTESDWPGQARLAGSVLSLVQHGEG
jgi:hypothetical protein